MKDPVTLLDSIKKGKILKQEEFDGYLRKIRGGKKSEEQDLNTR